MNMPSCSTSVSVLEVSDADDESSEWLIKINDARLGYPNTSNSSSHPLDLTIQPAPFGGHAVLGTNGSGKSLLSSALAHGSFEGPEWPHLVTGSLHHSHGTSVARVSFESHQALLAKGGSTYSALTPLGGLLSKAAQFLVVRFGLYGLLTRDVHTLSTGEIRKVLLIRALSTRPKLLVLDNAFDGLDVSSRQSLADLVSKTLKGFRSDILVQGVDAKQTAHTQVLLATHRPEEIVDEISTVTFLGESGPRTMSRDGRSGAELFQALLGHDEWNHDPWDDASLPSLEEIRTIWQQGKRPRTSNAGMNPIVEITGLRVSRGDKDLLSGLDWAVRTGERWLIVGGNGAGKSTLSRFLAQPDSRHGISDGLLNINLDADSVGWVSTERHLSLSASRQPARDILLGNDSLEKATIDVGDAVAMWLGLGRHQLS
jgi:molybdate transport system ATP-binding protein